MQSVHEGMWNKVEYSLMDSQKMTCQLEDYSNSKGMQSVLNGTTFKYNFGGGRFHMLRQSSINFRTAFGRIFSFKFG